MDQLDIFTHNFNEFKKTKFIRYWNIRNRNKKVIAKSGHTNIIGPKVPDDDLYAALIWVRKLTLLAKERGSIIKVCRILLTKLPIGDAKLYIERLSKINLSASLAWGSFTTEDKQQIDRDELFDIMVHGDLFHCDGRKKTRKSLSLKKSEIFPLARQQLMNFCVDVYSICLNICRIIHNAGIRTIPEFNKKKRITN